MIKEAGVGPFKKDVCESYKQLDLVCVNLERKMWRERQRERERGRKEEREREREKEKK